MQRHHHCNPKTHHIPNKKLIPVIIYVDRKSCVVFRIRVESKHTVRWQKQLQKKRTKYARNCLSLAPSLAHEGNVSECGELFVIGVGNAVVDDASKEHCRRH